MGIAHRWGAALAAVVFVAAAGCGKNTFVKGGKVQDVLEQDMNKGGYVESIGIGAAPSDVEGGQTQKRALSRDAAIVKAQYELLTMVKGVTIEGGITVSRAIEQDSTLEAKLKEVIRGAEILKTEYTSDDGAVVTMRLPKKRLEKMMGVRFQ